MQYIEVKKGKYSAKPKIIPVNYSECAANYSLF